MGHHQASFHASSIEFSEHSKVVCWRAGLSRGGTTLGHVVTWASPAMLSLEAWHGAQLQQIHLGFVNYRSELYNQTRIHIYQRIALSEAEGRVRAHVTLRYGVSYDEWVLSLGRPQRVDHLLVELVISRCVHLTHRLDHFVSLRHTSL